MPSEELRLQTSGKSSQASESRSLPDMAVSMGWLLASPLLSGSLSAVTAWAGVARHGHLHHPLPSRVPWHLDPRGEMPVPIPVSSGLKPCTWQGQNTNAGQGAPPETDSREVQLSPWVFSWVFKLLHHHPGNSWMSAVWTPDS